MHSGPTPMVHTPGTRALFTNGESVPYEFSQLPLIDSVLNDLGLTHSNKVNPVPVIIKNVRMLTYVGSHFTSIKTSISTTA